MKAKIHTLTELITTTLGPVFRAHSDYATIIQAMALVVARIAQSTPTPGEEQATLDRLHEIAKDALAQFLDLEKEELAREEARGAARQAVLEQGVEDFARINEGADFDSRGQYRPASDLKPGVLQGSAEDYPDNLPSLQDSKPAKPAQAQEGTDTHEGETSAPEGV